MTIKIYDAADVKENGIILSGNDHFIGTDEKRRAKEIIHIEAPFTLGNYMMFYAGSNEILKKAVVAMARILNCESKKAENKDYEIIINALHVVHHISSETRHSKLDGINSLSTSCMDNAYCLKRIASGDSVCAHCYSATQQKQQLALQDRNTINGIILRNIVIPVWAWKKYFKKENLSKYFRIESFGDVQNTTQCQNYINFINAFPRIHFAVWSKNIGIWNFAFLKNDKPANMTYVHSSNCVNKPETWVLKSHSFVDHIFTVFDKKYVKANSVNITCGGRACKECIKKCEKCYFKDDNKEVNEQLK